MKKIAWHLRRALILMLAGDESVALNFIYTGTLRLSAGAFTEGTERESQSVCFTGKPPPSAPIPPPVVRARPWAA